MKKKQLLVAGLFVTSAFLPASASAQMPRGEATSDSPRDIAEIKQGGMDKPVPSSDMATILSKLEELGAKPIGTLTVEQTRSQPSPADAATAVMKGRGIKADERFTSIKTEDMTIAGPKGDIALRVYTPQGTGPFPLIVYYHGGGWVIADLDTYDMSARALAAKTGAVVVSAHYRQAPENKFPAAHADAWAAYQWAVTHAGRLNIDIKKIAVAGESAGANLAANVALRARDAKTIRPVHELLVYPIAGNDMNTPSYKVNADAQPLSKKAMEWFVAEVFDHQKDTADPRINLVGRKDLQDLGDITVINAEIDPLLSEGMTYADHLKNAGNQVVQHTYPGVTHEFFGMVGVVPQADEATDLAARQLKASFDKVK